MPYSIRCATIEDVPVLTRHRRLMFHDMGHRDVSLLDAMSTHFTAWLTEHIRNGSYLAWLAEDNAKAIVAGAGLWFINWPPHILGPAGPRGYILNVYTEKEHRRNGLARRLTERCLEACCKRGIVLVALHASEHGRPLYESLGFEPTNEMRLKLTTENISGHE